MGVKGRFARVTDPKNKPPSPLPGFSSFSFLVIVLVLGRG